MSGIRFRWLYDGYTLEAFSFSSGFAVYTETTSSSKIMLARITKRISPFLAFFPVLVLFFGVAVQ